MATFIRINVSVKLVFGNGCLNCLLKCQKKKKSKKRSFQDKILGVNGVNYEKIWVFYDKNVN